MPTESLTLNLSRVAGDAREVTRLGARTEPPKIRGVAFGALRATWRRCPEGGHEREMVVR